MFHHLLGDKMHNFSLMFPCGYLSNFQELQVCSIWVHTYLYQFAAQRLSAKLTPLDYTLAIIFSIVGVEWSPAPPVRLHIPAFPLRGRRYMFFPFTIFELRATFQMTRRPRGRLARTCLGSPISRRDGRRPFSPLYKLPCIMRSKQRKTIIKKLHHLLRILNISNRLVKVNIRNIKI